LLVATGGEPGIARIADTALSHILGKELGWSRAVTFALSMLAPHFRPHRGKGKRLVLMSKDVSLIALGQKKLRSGL